MRIRQVILIINFDPKLGTFPQGNEVHSEYYGPRQRKYHVYSPKGHLYEGPMTRKMEVWGRDHVRSHCTANSTSDFDHQFWPKTGHFPKEVRSVTHATAPENANVTCTVPKDTYMKVQWQEKRRFEIGTTFSRTVLQIWPVILSINFEHNWAFPQGSEVRNACYGPRQHVHRPKGHLYEGLMTRQNGGSKQGPCSVALHCKFDLGFWDWLTKSGQFPMDLWQKKHVTGPDNENDTFTVPWDTYMSVFKP